MAHLAGEHGNLPPMVSIVCYQVSDESNYVRTKTLDASVAFYGTAYQDTEC